MGHKRERDREKRVHLPFSCVSWRLSLLLACTAMQQGSLLQAACTWDMHGHIKQSRLLELFFSEPQKHATGSIAV